MCFHEAKRSVVKMQALRNGAAEGIGSRVIFSDFLSRKPGIIFRKNSDSFQFSAFFVINENVNIDKFINRLQKLNQNVGSSIFMIANNASLPSIQKLMQPLILTQDRIYFSK